MGAFGVFGLIQLIAFSTYVRSKLSEDNFQLILRSVLYGVGGVIAMMFVGAILFQSKCWVKAWNIINTLEIAPFTGRFYSLLDPSYAKNNIPIIASVSEHQPTTWSSYYFDLQFLVFTFPVGLYYCFSSLNDGNIFIIIYALTSIYFSGVMVRLM